MKKQLLRSLAVLCLLAPAHAAFAEEACPVPHGGSNFLDDVVKAIEQTPNCARANAIAGACALGASGDSALVAPAITKCEAAFKGKLKARQKRAYQRQRKACVRKYARKEGTMYISMAAFCALKVAKRFAARYGAK